MASVTIDMPDDTFATLHRSPRELSQEMQQAAAKLPAFHVDTDELMEEVASARAGE